MPIKSIGYIHKGQVGKGWSAREKAHWYDPQGKSCNAGSPEYDMQAHVELSLVPTKEN